MQQRSDLTTQARIRDTALQLFAEQGYAATSIRAVAKGSGVSPALVIHHFESKAGLRAAIDEFVVRTIAEFLEGVDPGQAPVDEQFRAAAGPFLNLLLSRPELGGYLRRLILTGDEAGVGIMRRITALGQDVLDRYEAEGFIGPASDPEMRTLQLTLLDLGLILLGPMLTRYFDAPAVTPRLLERWIETELELLTQGVLTEPPNITENERRD